MPISQNNRNWIYIAISIATPTLLFILWFLLTPRYIPELTFPSPYSVWRGIRALSFNLVGDSLATLLRVLTGWSLGVVFGIVVGLLMTWSKAFQAIVNPIIEVVRPVPPIALIPFFIIWFGLGAEGQIILIALACFMVLAVDTYVSVHNVPPLFIRAAASLRASKGKIYRTIILPAILPSLVSGFRVAAALAFAVGVAAEFMGAQSGIGFLIMVSSRTLNTNVILLGTIILGIESFCFDWAIRRVSRWLMRWSETPIEAIERL